MSDASYYPLDPIAAGTVSLPLLHEATSATRRADCAVRDAIVAACEAAGLAARATQFGPVTLDAPAELRVGRVDLRVLGATLRGYHRLPDGPRAVVMDAYWAALRECGLRPGRWGEDER